MTGAYQGYTLVLVGHIDRSEPAARQLDRQRALNSAAVISANRDICTGLETNRIRVDWVGTETSEYKEAVAAAPANERAADRVNPNDPRTRNRRVEMWLVPPGQAMPSVAKQARALPAQEMQRLACPK